MPRIKSEPVPALKPAAARGAVRGLGLLTGWSRINDRKHCLSQVLLGWTIAWNAVDATRAGDDAPADAALSEET